MKKFKALVKMNFTDMEILFIKKYAIPDLGILCPIDEEKFDIIADYADKCELNMIDENGEDKQYDYPEKERDILGDKFVTFLSSYADKNYFIDYEELNKNVF
jgi:hypothetical protein